MTPEDLLYYKEHEWAKTDDNTAVIGISDYAQDALGDIVYVDLPSVGDKLSAGAVVGEVESVKSTSELHTPLSGTVTEINQKVSDTPEIINNDPYGEGWLFKIEMDNRDELNDLMNAKQYEDYIKEL
ncbi:MAG: glycine cleavage system protein H [Candidatus Aquicultor secundus]|uniref:Glycine cleavage system H protein n=1 Tax=Candidatus Aquicultor secundus TaxID=1973895 RepID=A0A2M7T943_9ACTN|nr:glycine cleavage system protein GcvH [Candidatus Aquicultor secundus]NCO66401.1 glycine cleavage system protein GcvH [Solirubrobacter sp.]OIO84927.1 MAG: glycine cleavage system protein H [Candidatus Aquicultor secundus]PIU26892.1 MAG: glycine cleavage system protein H [Candidatus Aquicultor secundus]PIW22031.1 MAG: glycine cleavage system protein H [Candidatus Aquicultor secundus]PIX52875.1 MAG: glycine cleavage system protein H [Candidatus Aquicultor secundus]